MGERVVGHLQLRQCAEKADPRGQRDDAVFQQVELSQVGEEDDVAREGGQVVVGQAQALRGRHEGGRLGASDLGPSRPDRARRSGAEWSATCLQRCKKGQG